MSSAGIGSLNKILNNLSRTDLLDFGDGRKIKKRFPNIVSDHYSYRKVELWKRAKPLLFDLAEAFGYMVIFSNFERVIGYTIL